MAEANSGEACTSPDCFWGFLRHKMLLLSPKRAIFKLSKVVRIKTIGARFDDFDE